MMSIAEFGYKSLLRLVLCFVYVICSVDTQTTPISSMLTTTFADESFCIRPWQRLNQRCYLPVTEKYNFDDASQNCTEAGGHLVSINNDTENDIIMSLSTTYPLWIGLYRQTTECNSHASCVWMWLDGSHAEYSNWASSYLTPFLCVVMESDGLWSNSRNCSGELEFICERSLSHPTTTSEATTMMATRGMVDPSSTQSTSPVNVDFAESEKDVDEDDMPIIIGCVVGGLVLVAIVTGVVVILLKRHRTSSQADQPMEDKDEETPKVDKHVRYNPAYEDVAFKPSPGNMDTGAPGKTDTGAHGVGDNPHNIYSEAIKKRDRPGSEGILVKENTLYGYGK